MKARTMTNPVQFSRYLTCLIMSGGVLIAAPSSSADTGDFESYRCNAPSGSGDGTVLPFVQSGTTIAGKISVHSADVGTEWASVVKILAHQRGAHNADGDCGCNGIAVYAFRNPDHIEFYTTVDHKEVYLDRSASFDMPISFQIAIDPKGAMTVSVGKHDPSIQTVALRHPEHDTLELTCSGADVSFLNLDIP